MKQHILLIISLLLFSVPVQSQTVWTESFESGGWTLASSSNLWVISDSTTKTSVRLLKQKNLRITCDTCSSQQPLYKAATVSNLDAKMNADIPGGTLSNAQLVLRLYYRVNGNVSNDFGRLIFSLDAGSTWNVYPTVKFFDAVPRWRKMEIKMSDLAGWSPGNPIRFGFRWENDNVGSSGGLIVDEMSIFSQQYDVYNTNQTIHVNAGTSVTFKDAKLSNANIGTVENDGVLDFTSDVENHGAFTNGGGSSGKIRMSGTNVQYLGGNSTISTSKLQLDNSLSASVAIVQDGDIAISDSMLLNTGVLANAELDTVELGPSIEISGGSANSYLAAIVQHSATSGSRFFPIGNLVRYRPIYLTDFSAAVGSKTSFYYRGVSTGGSPAMDLDSISTMSFWKGSVDQGSLISTQVQLSFANGGWEGTVNPDSARVAFAASQSGKYSSYGNSSNGANFVKGDPIDTLAYFTIGYAKDSKIDVNAFLQGNLNEGTLTMTDDLSSVTWGGSSYVSILDSVAKNHPFLRMRRGSNVPTGAVDIIKVELRTSNTGIYSVHDSSYAWLMNDGTVRDFRTGANSYLTFTKLGETGSAIYYPVIYHRNHIPVMLTTPIQLKFSSPVLADFTDYNNIEGGGARYFGADRASLWMGNAYDDPLLGDEFEVNASDFLVVSVANDNNPSAIYMNEDINLDGIVNADDFTAVQQANDNLYSTTIP